MRKQVSNSPFPLGFKIPSRQDIKLIGIPVIESNIITQDSIFFLDGELLTEGIDNHYSVTEGEVELHLSNFKNKQLSILTF